jgi:hypothetical protein
LRRKLGKLNNGSNMKRTLLAILILICIQVSFSFAGTKVKVTVPPVANGNYAGWAASAGADWQCVDEEPHNSDVDFVAAGVNSRECFKMDTTQINDSVASNATVDSIRVSTTFRILTFDEEATIDNMVRIGSTNYDGGGFGLLTSYATRIFKWATNPSTSAAWTLAQIKAIQCGVSYLQVSGYDCRLTQVLLEVYADVPAGEGGRSHSILRDLRDSEEDNTGVLEGGIIK